MKPMKGKLFTDDTRPLSDEMDVTSRPDGSHVVTLDSNLIGIPNPIRLDEFISTEYHLTATIPNKSLSVRDLSLLLDVLNYQIVVHQLNFSMLLACTELLLRLTGGRYVNEISDAKIRKTVMVSWIIVKEFQKQSLSLYHGETAQLRPEIVELLKPYLMSKRTYMSRYRLWRPEYFIKIVAVPVSILYERTSSNSIRYSGYTKGYGESHGNAHRKKTKPSFELDGEDVPDREERNLILRMTDQQHQISNGLWIKYLNLMEGS